MKESEVLAPLANLDKLIELETARLQKQKYNENLPDPSEAGLFTVERITPVTPAAVAQSVKVLVRNAALKNIGADNLADETNAREKALWCSPPRAFQGNARADALKCKVPPLLFQIVIAQSLVLELHPRFEPAQ